MGVVRNDARNRRVTIEHSERLPPPHFAQVLTEVRFEVRNPYLLHDLIMVMTSHIVKPTAARRGTTHIYPRENSEQIFDASPFSRRSALLGASRRIIEMGRKSEKEANRIRSRA